MTPVERAVVSSGKPNPTPTDEAPALHLDVAQPTDAGLATAADSVMTVQDLSVYYGDFLAVHDVDLRFGNQEITALIGPSGCARVEGSVTYRGVDIYGPDVDEIEVRRRVGMVFQKPNPFPKSIYDNVSYGPRVTGMKVDLNDTVEQALRGAALWDEVKDKLRQNAYSLSGGQQQRLCIARAIATQPEVILMDEPCSSLDPIATAKIEDLMAELTRQFTIIIVTHNMQQAARVSGRTAFFTAEADENGNRIGRLVEFDSTAKIFRSPGDPRTEAYISGRFG
jgi:phosphate transport system ATP-binding protein